jgi:hypothetical protein
MMPLEKALAICQEAKLLAGQCKQELDRLHDSCVQAESFVEAARGFLEEAKFTPPSQFEEPPPAPLTALPLEKGDSTGWHLRAQESRVLAEKATDANVRNELLAIAELYDLLGAVEYAPTAAGEQAA